MSTHNICFSGEIRKLLRGYPLLSVAMRKHYRPLVCLISILAHNILTFTTLLVKSADKKFIFFFRKYNLTFHANFHLRNVTAYFLGKKKCFRILCAEIFNQHARHEIIFSFFFEKI